MASYCEYVANLPEGERKKLHQNYHDFHYGFPIENDDLLFGRLILEINQAGLSWEIILKKEAAFYEAFEQFQIQKVAQFTAEDVRRLVENKEIIRNKKKIEAVIKNAQTLVKIQQEFGSFYAWLQLHKTNSLEEWVKLFRKTFVFMGPKIVHEFLMSIGLLPGAHDENCPINRELSMRK